MPLAVAVDVAKGDPAKLREDMVLVRRLLQDCRGKVLAGFAGEPDLMELAQEILELAEAVTDDMISVQRRNRRARRAST